MKLLNSTLVLLISFCLIGCYQFDQQELNNLEDRVVIIGHGGSGFSSWIPFNPYPANSLKSVQKAFKAGADGVEVDVHMSADNDFLIYHDNRLESKTSRNGCPSEFTLAELTELNYHLGFPFDLFQEESLCSLKDLVAYLNTQHPDKALHLDLRNYSDCLSDTENQDREMDFVRNLRDSLINWEIDLKKVTIITYSWKILSWLKEENFAGELSLELADRSLDNINWAKENEIHSLTLKPDLMDANFSDSLHQLGFELITFGAKSKSGNLKLLRKRADVIQTDNIKALKELLND